MDILLQTYDGRQWHAPYPAGHLDDRIEFNRTQHQTRGGGVAWMSGSGLPKPVAMQVEIPCTKPVDIGQAPWDDQSNRREMIVRRREFWEDLLEQTERWYCGARYREVLGVQLFDRSDFHVVRATLLVRSPGWFLAPDDQWPRRYPFEEGLGLYPLGMLRVVDDNTPRVYEVEYLGGVTGTPVTYTAPYTGLAFHPLELNHD